MCCNPSHYHLLRNSRWFKRREILARTRGNLAFALFYEVFVLACFVHAPIGLANILRENIQSGFLIRALPVLLAAFILILGTAAVIGVVWGTP